MVWALLSVAPNLLAALCPRSQTWAQKVQVFYGALAFTIMLLYLSTLVATLGGTMVERFVGETTTSAINSATSPSASALRSDNQVSTAQRAEQVEQSRLSNVNEASSLKKEWPSRWPNPLKNRVIFIAFLGLTVRFNLKQSIADVAPILCAANSYLSIGMRRDQIMGELVRLIDQLDERAAARYRKLHLVAYSFGSVVALDALFPQDGEVPKRLN